MAEIQIDPHTTWVAVNYTCGTCGGRGQVERGAPGTMPTQSRCDDCGGGGIRTTPLTLANLRKFLLEPVAETIPPTPTVVQVEAPSAAPETAPLPTIDAPALEFSNPVTGEVAAQ